MNAPGGDAKVKQWSAAVPLKTPDNIVSSQYTMQKVFLPSYERDKRPCIEQLLTNEYQRIWWQEKEIWDKRHNRKPTTKKLLQRMVIKKKVFKENVLELPKKSRKPRKQTQTEPRKDVDVPKEDKAEGTCITETTEKKGDNKVDGAV
ncbi:hypothetical protein WN55_05169 [Dufourea novaeangliae]|uniref:Uncharacterized protein n=1 Tax=Dufourea novaeangliae TaxID=178035 RepID=A0A154PPE8_DUFNO|nr:hypothetical protein WN55_05169 [Dufourea novaeangliae]